MREMLLAPPYLRSASAADSEVSICRRGAARRGRGRSGAATGTHSEGAEVRDCVDADGAGPGAGAAVASGASAGSARPERRSPSGPPSRSIGIMSPARIPSIRAPSPAGPSPSRAPPSAAAPGLLPSENDTDDPADLIDVSRGSEGARSSWGRAPSETRQGLDLARRRGFAGAPSPGGLGEGCAGDPGARVETGPAGGSSSEEAVWLASVEELEVAAWERPLSWGACAIVWGGFGGDLELFWTVCRDNVSDTRGIVGCATPFLSCF
jgi:hypothetical protein